MSVKNMPSSRHYIIYSPPIGCAAPLYSPPKCCEQHQPKTRCVGSVFGKHPLIADASTTICTRPNSRAAPLCPNLDGNLCTTLTAHSEPLPFSELAETRSRQVIHISITVLGCTYTLSSFLLDTVTFFRTPKKNMVEIRFVSLQLFMQREETETNSK